MASILLPDKLTQVPIHPPLHRYQSSVPKAQPPRHAVPNTKMRIKTIWSPWYSADANASKCPPRLPPSRLVLPRKTLRPDAPYAVGNAIWVGNRSCSHHHHQPMWRLGCEPLSCHAVRPWLIQVNNAWSASVKTTPLAVTKHVFPVAQAAEVKDLVEVDLALLAGHACRRPAGRRSSVASSGMSRSGCGCG